MVSYCSFLFILPIASSLSNFPIVQTSYGAVRGYEYRAKNGFVAEIFKKIPYAASPTGRRRWKKPEPPQPWNYTLDGTFFGPACPQVPSRWAGYVTGQSEDCLTLNIYSSKQCRESTASCPVVFYVHGGSMYFGGPLMFKDEVLIKNFATQGVILVTGAYRLGPFGVMALGDENVLPANLAMHDVLESLRFIRREIHVFGGDKDQVTLMGESTGASLVLAFVFSPAVIKPGEVPLFARAIVMSATASYEKEGNQIDVSHMVAEKLGCTGSAQQIIDCMRPMSWQKIINAANEVGGANAFSKTQLSGLTLAGELMPIHNMRDLRDQQADHMSTLAGSRPTDLMIGTLLNEFGAVSPLPDDRRVQATDILGVRNPEECIEKYWNDVDSGIFVPGYETLSQGFFETTALFAQAQARAKGKVYMYQFDYPNHTNHADELFYILGIHDFPMDANEEWLSQVVPIYFTNFIKGLPLAPDWAPLDPNLMNYYSINKSFTAGVSPTKKLGYRQNLVDYFNEMLNFDEKLTAIKTEAFNDPIQLRDLTIGPYSSHQKVFFCIAFFSCFIVMLKCRHCCGLKVAEKELLL